ncbi:MAG TPA: hypothetical protein PKD17_05960, partial [Cellvibrionaceae bacterium]|nr:hypothetical protein [Cellvibrionaceae bacterium]
GFFSFGGCHGMNLNGFWNGNTTLFYAIFIEYCIHSSNPARAKSIEKRTYSTAISKISHPHCSF